MPSVLPLDEFDEFVRNEMPQAMDKSSLRLIHCWIIGLALLGRGHDRQHTFLQVQRRLMQHLTVAIWPPTASFAFLSYCGSPKRAQTVA